MKINIYLLVFLLFPIVTFSQKVTYSDYDSEDNRNINFDIIGKMNGSILVYKNIRWKHKIHIFDNEMKIKESVKLDFIPEKTFNVDFVIYPSHFYMIYQYQKRNVLYCMGVKINGDGKQIGEPVQLDTTQISMLADNKIYTTINSDDKKHIMIFKIHKKNDNHDLVTLLFNEELKMVHKTRQALNFNERKDNYSNFLVDNEGNFVFIRDGKTGNRDNSNELDLVVKKSKEDSLIFHPINLEKNYIDEAKLKIDNLNNRYLINSFFYKKNRGSIDGLFTYVWDKNNDSAFAKGFIELDENLRNEAKTSGQIRFALDDFFIRQIFVKRDGGFLITAEDFSSKTIGNNNSWNRWDYLNNYNYSPYSYYYNPYNGYYRPLNSFGNQNTRYYYSNIIILSADKTGKIDWNKVIHKEQFDDNEDNFLSFATMNNGGEIHFIFNDDKNRNQIIANQSISASGQITRNPTLKSRERGYQFMTRLSKQVSANELIIPCAYRGYICFAKVEL